MNILYVDNHGNTSLVGEETDYFIQAKQLILDWKNNGQLSVFTSGSTGKPKEILLTKKQVEASVYQTKQAFGIDSKTVIICNLPTSYIAGKMMIIRALVLQIPCYLIEPSRNPFKGKTLFFDEIISKNKGNLFFSFIPLQLKELVQNQESIQILNNAKVILIGGSSIDSKLKEELDVISAPIFATYGMTETVTHIAIQNLKTSEDFTFLPNISHKVNKNKCLKIKGLVTNNKWIQTNDIIEYTSDHSFKIIGRIDNVINSGGIKIHLEEIDKKIDAYLLSKNLHISFFSYGLSDKLLGKKLVLFLEDTDSKSINEVKKILKSKLSKYEVPKEFLKVKNFKFTHTNKIDKKRTVNEYLQSSLSNR